MSPQNSTLGLLGGNFFKSSTQRTDFRSGMYRPEENALIRNYAGNIDNFYATGNIYTYSTSILQSVSGMFIKPQLDKLYLCGGCNWDQNQNQSGTNAVSFDNNICTSTFSKNGKISSISSTTEKIITWYTGSTPDSWYPEPTGISFKSDGTQVILCGNLVYSLGFGYAKGPIIFQYSMTTPWDPSTIQGLTSGSFVFGGTSYTIANGLVVPSKLYAFNPTPTSTSPRINDIFVNPDGTTFYYLMIDLSTNASTLYQGSISSAWDIGSTGGNLTLNTASLTIDPTLVSNYSLTGYFHGISFNSTGTKLYVISKYYGGIIYQYNLGTAWQISTATFNNFLYVGGFKGEMPGTSTSIYDGHSILMLPNEETMICGHCDSSNSKLYEYSVLPY